MNLDTSDNQTIFATEKDLENEIENGAGCSILLNAINCPDFREVGFDEEQDGGYLSRDEGEVRRGGDI